MSDHSPEPWNVHDNFFISSEGWSMDPGEQTTTIMECVPGYGIQRIDLKEDVRRIVTCRGFSNEQLEEASKNEAIVCLGTTKQFRQALDDAEDLFFSDFRGSLVFPVSS